MYQYVRELKITFHVFKPGDLFKLGRLDETSTSSNAPEMQ